MQKDAVINELKQIDRELGLFRDSLKGRLAMYQANHLTEMRDRLQKLWIKLELENGVPS
jgi:hypothetical protein